MAELLVKAVAASHTDSVRDTYCYKLGMFVDVREDNSMYGTSEQLPLFVVIRFPLVPRDRLIKYIQEWRDLDGFTWIRRRIWRIRWSDLPQGAQDTLRIAGQLVIKARDAYTGPYDYTWAQVKSYFRNDATGLDETGDL